MIEIFSTRRTRPTRSSLCARRLSQALAVEEVWQGGRRVLTGYVRHHETLWRAV